MAQLVTDLKEVSGNCSTIVELLRYRALHQPDTDAFTFLEDGETKASVLTYQELDRRSRAIAAQLQVLGLSKERALLLYPPGLDYLAAFFGCLYAGVVAVPAYPPRNQRNMPRIQAILADAQAKVALTTTAVLSQMQSLMAQKTEPDNLKWLATDSISNGTEDSWQQPSIERETLAFLQYTSGSTGTPKGVMLSHGNLLHNAVTTYRFMEHSSRSKFVSWLPIYHDMGLIGGVLQPLYGGFPCIMMPPAAFLQRPYRWLSAISRYQGTTSGAPNFAYELCVQKITPEQRSTLDLSSWDVAFNGAEPIRQHSLEQFALTFADCGFRSEAFYPCYGMAEATLMVSGSVKADIPATRTVQKTALECNQVVDAAPNDQNAQPLVSCGRTLPEQQIAIANPETLTPCAPDEIGEVWVCGPSIGHGYWNRPEETEQIFRAYLKDTGEGPFLRTGDLGFLHNGELFITGRAKDLIIIRGRNLYPQDIELTAERSHPVLRAGCGAAFTIEVDDEERLVVVQEVEFRAKPNVDEVTAAIRQAVAEEHEVQLYAVVLIKAGNISKTSSGKIQRRATKARFLAATLEVVGSSILEITQTTEEDFLTRTELLAVEPEQRQQLLNTYLQKLVASVLMVVPSQVEGSQPLSSLGLDSLKVFELKNRFEIDFGVTISVADFFDGASIAELETQILDQVNSNLTSVYLSISKVETATSQHPLSFTQQQLWFINQLQPGTATYNIPVAVHLTGRLNVSAFIRSLNEIIQRHEILRTSFEVVDGEPIQKVVDAVTLTVPEVDLRHLPDEQQQSEVQKLSLQEAQSSFDLGQAPLLRAKLLHLQEEQSILVLTLHHIVCDGWSIKLLVQELSAIYRAFSAGKPSPLPELPVQYADFVYWQRNWLQGEVIEKHLAYWQQQLGENLPVLQLPTDRARPPIQAFRGSQQKFVLSKALTEAIKQLSQRERVTLFMTLLAAFQTLLYRYTGQEDILVGSPIANRNRTELEQLIGCFVNTLVLRTNLEGNPTFTELLGRVRKVAVDAYTHQDLPFKKLVEALQPNRDLSYNPLFQVMFVLQNLASDSIWRTEELNTGTVEFDICLSMIDSEEGLVGTLEYNTDLFNADTITRMVGHFQTLLESIICDSNQGISELAILTPAERQTLLWDWNNTKVDYPQEACIHQLFEAQVEKTPDAIAVIFENQKLTYQELNKRANQLAYKLIHLGVKPETLVGICMERSLEMIIGILAIMKAGGAYVPLDPAYPPERLAFIFKDAQVPVLVTQEQLVNKLPNHTAKIVYVDTTNLPSEVDEYHNNPLSPVSSENLVYVIYTSGSTGKSKGVMIQHRSLTNAYLAWEEAYQLRTAATSHLQMASFSFDVFTGDLVRALCSGGKLVLCPRYLLLEPEKLYELMLREKIDCADFVPAVLRSLIAYLEQNQKSLGFMRLLICGSDSWYVQEYERFRQFCGSLTRLINAFGLTEATIDSTYFEAEKIDLLVDQLVPIGSPFANTQIYILDSYFQPVPVGVIGEIYIGGTGVARGYLHRSDLTAEKFIPNLFSHKPGGILYKTGDLGRYLPDRQIELIGRIDNQVKIRGFRIELGEIEASLAQHPNVQETVVIAREDASWEIRLVAYVVPAQKVAFSVNELRHFLKEKLPEYMLPYTFVLLEALPLTPNGKVDRRALPAPENLCPELAINYQAPQSEVEKTIAKVWEQVLQIEKVGIHDNFFDLGGHSLLALQVKNKLRENLNRDLSIVEIFQNPTIKLLAQHLSQKSELQNAEKRMHGLADRVQKHRESLNQRNQAFVQRRKNIK